MNTQICPKCGEENPDECVICWACYTPLGHRSQRTDATPHEDKSKLTATEKARRAIANAWPLLLIGAFTANGWLPRRARLPVLGACVATVGGIFAEQKWIERKNQQIAEDDEPPTVRIAQTILLYAAKENATAIRMWENGKGVKVEYQIEGEWREQIKIPIYVWRPLRQLLLEYARQGTVQFKRAMGLSPEKSGFRLDLLSAELETGATGETLELQFESAPPKAAETLPQLAPEKRCKCHEANAPGAVWCWNCYAPLQDQSKRSAVSLLKQNAAEIAMLSILGALGSSGWWPRRARRFALGAGALGLAAEFARCPLQERFKDFKVEIGDFKIERSSKEKEIELPVARVVSQILSRALQARATHLRLREHGNVVVSSIDSETEFEIKFPAYVWLALRNSLLDSARQGVCTIGAAKRNLSAELRCDINGETLDLHLEEI